jgi:transcriptional regulator MraZ
LAFHGQHEHSLDSKDRLTIPARFRSALADGVILVKGLDPCVEVFPLQEFTRFEQRDMAEFSTFSRDQRRMRRRIYAHSVDERLDSAGRIRIPGHLIEHAGLDGPSVIVGVGEHLEIWSPETWGAEDSEVDAHAHEIAEGLGGEGSSGG